MQSNWQNYREVVKPAGRLAGLLKRQPGIVPVVLSIFFLNISTLVILDRDRAFIIIFLTLLLCFEVEAQQTVQGRVETIDGAPLPFASVGIVGTSMGTITNEAGEFSLIIVPSISEVIDSIRFSYVGYSSVVRSVESMKILTIVQLDEAIQLLDEIVILPQELLKNPKKIVAQAISNISINNDNNGFLLKGFYRHTNREGNDYKRLLEAAITVQDQGYSSNMPVLFNVDEIRKSVDSRKGQYIPWVKEMFYGKTPESTDVVVTNGQQESPSKMNFKELKSLAKNSRNKLKEATASDLQYWESKHNWHSLYYFYYGNYARPRVVTEARKSTFYGELNTDFLKQHKFKLDTISSYDGELVYVIKILPSARSEKYMYEKVIIPVGKLYIRTSDMAVLRMEYSYILNPKKKGRFDYEFNYTSKGTRIMFKTTAIYREFQGKMYLSYLSKHEYDKVAYSFGKWKKDVKNKYFFMEREFMVNEIITDSDRIQEEVSSKAWDENLYTNKKPYNEGFWKNYTIIKETPIQEKLRKDLEQKISLEEQFKKSGNQ